MIKPLILFEFFLISIFLVFDVLAVKPALGAMKSPWLEDPITQWMDWEAEANTVDTRRTQPKRTFELSYACVPASKVDIFATTKDRERWAPLFRQPCPAGAYAFPVHPFNKEYRLTFNKDRLESPPPGQHPFVIRLSASRTVTLDLRTKSASPPGLDTVIGLKLPTDYPFQGIREDKFTGMRSCGVRGLTLSAYITAVQKKRLEQKQSPLLKENFNILPEVYMQAADPNDLIGPTVVVRDLSLLAQSGNYYLPAFSVYAKPGMQIAQGAGANSLQEIKDYWDEHLVKPVAELTAHLLVNYGIIQVNPHTQQFLIEIDAQSHQPTGMLYLRDLCDLILVKELLPLLGTDTLFAEFFGKTGVRWAPGWVLKAPHKIHGMINDIVYSLLVCADPEACFDGALSSTELEAWQMQSWTLYDQSFQKSLATLLPHAADTLNKLEDFKLLDEKAFPPKKYHSAYRKAASQRAHLYMSILTSSELAPDWEIYRRVQPSFEELGFPERSLGMSQ